MCYPRKSCGALGKCVTLGETVTELCCPRGICVAIGKHVVARAFEAIKIADADVVPTKIDEAVY